MAIIKHIAIHRSPLKLIRYILKVNKTDEMKLATGLNCSTAPESAYEEMGSTFERFAKERFSKKSQNADVGGKEKIRLHHYIQSFKPNEITPEQAHRIGVEWAEKVFGRDRQVLVTTHIDRRHIHNHFAVAAYDLNGKMWYDNKSTLGRCRDISDKICKAHGLSVIENQEYHSNQKYSDWLARQRNVSWKTRLCDDIDKLVLQEEVRSVEDLAEQLRQKGYTVTLKKYMSIKTPWSKKAIRSLRLGDGYGIEELQYRIENKNREISFSAVAKYNGIQREYAMCLRKLQIMVYRKPDNSYNATYGELRRNAELLTYLCDNKIRSVEDFQNVVNAAAEKSDKLKKSRDKLLQEISERENILKDGARFVELNSIKMPTVVQFEELAKLNYLAKYNLRSEEDIKAYGQEFERLKAELFETEKNLEIAEKEKSAAANNYKTYLRQMQSDYDFILERQRREQEEIKQAEQDLLIEQKALQELKQQARTNQTYYR
ncbi:MAG: relaxase/mobilization nuclease domain-containing protein [Oscillospiraceae bacterium]|nr:relaxase/mobilization nuclease domain-containing protein [Oscillospiraceae bacterium]